MSAPRRTLAASSLLVAMSLVLAACGGDDNKQASSDEPSDSTNTASALTLNGEWPLTGEKLDGALPDHPVYVVKIDNTANSAPQVGLGSADMVVEELVEGGLTRLAVFYYQDTPDKAGPVRSLRASDIGIVKPVSATVIASGGARPTVNRLSGASVATLTEGSRGFSRDSSRSAPYNLFMALKELADKPGSYHPPTDAYLPFGDEKDFSGNIPVKAISAQFSGGTTTNWKYTDKGWTRPGSYAQSGDDFTADNVLLLRVRVGDAGYHDPAGNPVPETRLVGKGEAVLVHGNKGIECRWSKKSRDSSLTLYTKAGKKVSVPAGHTWIELVPQRTGKVRLLK
ncbi:MAG: DUF3048 domain-containing protein [Nocardioidaceae bacterium]